MTPRLPAVPLATLSLALVSAAPPRAGKGHGAATPDGIQWVGGPASLQKGAKTVILEGDPIKTGPSSCG